MRNMPKRVWIPFVVILTILIGGRYFLMNLGHTPAPVTRANGHLRSLMTALEDMHRDSVEAKDDGREFPYSSPFQSDGFRLGPVDEIFPALVESTSYINGMPMDTLADPPQSYLAAASGETVILISVGKNGVLDIGEEELANILRNSDTNSGALDPFRYSPTNGAESEGDLFRVGGLRIR